MPVFRQESASQVSCSLNFFLLIVTMPKLSIPVSIKGEMLNETVHYEVFVPRGTHITLVADNQQVSVN